MSDSEGEIVTDVSCQTIEIGFQPLSATPAFLHVTSLSPFPGAQPGDAEAAGIRGLRAGRHFFP